MRRKIITAIGVASFVLGPGGALATAQPLRDTDPRSPDARDAATLVVVPSGVIAKSKPVSVSKHDGDSGLGAAEVGAGAGVVVLMALGTGLAAQKRRRRTAPRPA